MTSNAYVNAIPVGQLFADDTYQRPLDAGRARRIGAGCAP